MSDYQYSTAVINFEKPELGTRLSAHRCEDFLHGVIDLVAQGYTLREGEVYASLTGYQAAFTAPVSSKPIAPVKVVEAVVQVIDAERIAAMDGDKKLLDEYGKILGVSLNRSKTFKNMLADLEKGLK